MKIFNTLLITIFSLTFQVSNAQYASVDFSKTTSNRKSVERINYSDWAFLLRRNTSIYGTIDFSGFNLDKNNFEKVVNKLSSIKITNDWIQDEQIAYWLNTYNVFSIKLITDHFPIKNINEIEKPYKKEFFEINGEIMNLNDIENNLKKFNDPRLLIVLNRNSMSGAKISKLAYKPNNLNEQLDKRMRIFINNDSKNKITNSSASLSPIFKLYKKEIDNHYGSMLNFINKYSNTKITKRTKISFKSYDYTVNSYQAFRN